MSTIEERLGSKSSCSGLETRDYGRKESTALTTRHPSLRKKLALTSPTSGDRSVVWLVRGLKPRILFFVLFCSSAEDAAEP
jgi:hypothetical protein